MDIATILTDTERAIATLQADLLGCTVRELAQGVIISAAGLPLAFDRDGEAYVNPRVCLLAEATRFPSQRLAAPVARTCLDGTGSPGKAVELKSAFTYLIRTKQQLLADLRLQTVLLATTEVKAPTPEEVQLARKAVGLTQGEAAKLVHLSHSSRWSEYESGASTIDLARWELFLAKTKGLSHV